MIIVTGGAGFIGSALVWRLNQAGLDDILVVDHLGESDKWKNLVNLRYSDYLHKEDFLEELLHGSFQGTVDCVFHMGACSATTERDADYLADNNYRYSKLLADWCVANKIRFIYASSAATYGDGARGYSDEDAVTRTLRPLNMYGYSKQMFDLYALRQEYTNTIVGLKFFNVYGPNEYHKGEMRSVVHKALPQILETGRIRLFRSHQEGIEDGDQKRDFVYIKDILEILFFFFENRGTAGIFNAGTGQARSFRDLAGAMFRALGKPANIEYIDMPQDLRDRYQYFTEADLNKLRAAGYKRDFTPMEEAIADYVNNYLLVEDPCLGNS